MQIINQQSVIWEDSHLHQDVPSLTPYLIDDKPDAPIVLVIPGGGYGHRAYHEGEPVAQWLNQHGLHACVLRYQVAPIKEQETIKQGQQAILTIMKLKQEWGLTPDSKIGVLGFSAGGHLAAYISNCYLQEGESLSRPDFQILCYPVITMKEKTHGGSRANLIGETPSHTLINQHSCEEQVHDQTPPAFIWSTANDQAVSTSNSLAYASALQLKDVPYELHIYQDGRHGLGLADEHPATVDWKQACLQWLEHYII
ncbi:alpha/beta hydrolase [Gracilibacillus alcaliphilus]|uniref:alpha/beta hydrolase n=1 Tax=Gracilibacillus alcaliphilus TaxID=1401441 RepID=UPI00195C0A2C|nr:alpha/beta hydrolase [Gracilibacillus alcaliphilus]MBM7679311.1 acetyl esterase/lipase [Gracilibacillus alcaliphilus]